MTHMYLKKNSLKLTMTVLYSAFGTMLDCHEYYKTLTQKVLNPELCGLTHQIRSYKILEVDYLLADRNANRFLHCILAQNFSSFIDALVICLITITE